MSYWFLEASAFNKILEFKQTDTLCQGRIWRNFDYILEIS